jgi:hypothetical protein
MRHARPPQTREEMQEPVGDAPRSPGAERRTAATKLAAAHKGKKTRRKLAEEMWLKQQTRECAFAMLYPLALLAVMALVTFAGQLSTLVYPAPPPPPPHPTTPPLFPPLPPSQPPMPPSPPLPPPSPLLPPSLPPPLLPASGGASADEGGPENLITAKASNLRSQAKRSDVGLATLVVASGALFLLVVGAARHGIRSRAARLEAGDAML